VRILKVVQAYYPFQEMGGPVTKVRALARGLAERGHQITVLTADLGLGDRRDDGFSVQRSAWGWRFLEGGVEAIYLPTVAHYRALTINPRVVRFCRGCLGSFDLTHFYGLYDLLGPAVGSFCRRRRTPYVIEPMGMYRPIDRSFRLKRFWHGSLGSAFWRNATRIIATSELEREELLHEGVPAERVVIRYNGIDPESYTPLPPRGHFRAKWNLPFDQPLILFLGRLIPRKKADLLIEAFADAYPSAGRLVIAGPEGEAGYRSYLENCARKLGVESRTLFTGALYDEEKKAAMADADLFVLPSRYENFANAPAEAMACGTPVVVSHSCGIRSLVEGRAGLVIAPEKETLVQALRELRDNASLYARLKEGCRKVAAELSWQRLSEQMEHCYTDVLREGGAVRLG